jgi:hypothetical protein
VLLIITTKRLCTSSFTNDKQKKEQREPIDIILIEALLTKTTDLTVQDQEGNTLLHHYIRTAFEDHQRALPSPAVEYMLLDLLVQKTNQINTPNSKGETPIFEVTRTIMGT